MEFFHKNKRQFRFCIKRTSFCALFLSILLFSSALISLMFNASAELAPIHSVEIYSEHTNYENNEPGSWKVTKSAKWTSKTTAEISFNIDSITKLSGNDKDIILVLDNSTSMDENADGSTPVINKLDSVKRDARELINNTLDNHNSQIALISFATDANIVVPFTNDTNELLSGLDSMAAYGSTNYYKALVKVEELLNDYDPQNERDIIVIFVTDGLPVKQTPLEIYEYRSLKNNHQNVIINAVQYNMGETVVPQLAAISDNQFIVQNSSKLDKVLFEAASVPFYYNSFIITDYIDTNYWSLGSANANIGIATANADEQSITWDLGHYFRPGQDETPELTIELSLKEEYHEVDGRWPTNTREIITSAIQDGASENVSSSKTPALQHKYNVSYDANLPAGCTSSALLPETNRYYVFDTIEIQRESLVCEDYKFMGWYIANLGVTRINEDYFIMPNMDITLRAVWAKISIGKSMEGTVNERVSAKLDTGEIINTKLKRLSGQNAKYYYEINNTITAIKYSPILAPNIDLSNSDHIISTQNSALPIYAWYDEGIIYFYSEADTIYANENLSLLFYNFTGLVDISGLKVWDTSLTNNLRSSFQDTAITNVLPLSTWDTSNVSSFSQTFDYTKSLTDISGLSNWSFESATDLSYMFSGASAITDISALRNWDVSNVTKMRYFFSNTIIADFTPISGWDTSNVADMSYMFAYNHRITNTNAFLNWDVSNVSDMSSLFSTADALTDISGLANWDTSNVTNLSSIFYQANSLENLHGLENWNVSNVKNMYSFFGKPNSGNPSKLKDITALKNWDVSNVENMNSLFECAYSLSDISALANWNTASLTTLNSAFQYTQITNTDALSNWNVSSVTSLKSTFSNTVNLSNLNGLANWDVSKVENMQYMLNDARSITNVDALINWKTSSLKKIDNLFGGYNGSANSLENVDGLINWDISNVTSLNGVFNSTSSLKNVDGLINWDTSNVTSMNSTFYGARSLENVNGLANWNVSNVTSMDGLFSSAISITTIAPLANWNTSNVVKASGMFLDARSLKNIEAMSNWNLSKVNDFSWMFGIYSSSLYGSIEDLTPISNLIKGNVTNISNILRGQNKFISLSSLSNWDTSGITNMSYAFSRCDQLTDLSALSTWDVSSVTNMQQMFSEDVLITNLTAIENWNTTNLENTTDMFKNIPDSITRPSWYISMYP